MSTAVATEPQVLHSLVGRMRVHLPGWSGGERRQLERQLRRLPGVLRAEANTSTRNVLVQYDPEVTDAGAVLAALKTPLPSAPPQPEPQPPPVVKENQGRRQRARIAVRGLDRDPSLSRRVVDRLQRHPGVRARANPLTGRVLVEFDQHRVELDDLIAEVTDLELPDLPGEDRPNHPLDPMPLFQSGARTVGAALGLALLGVRRLFGLTRPIPGATPAVVTNSVISVMRSFPSLRNGMRQWLGRDAADLVFSMGAALTLTVSNNPVGLAVTGGEAYVLLREVLARRNAFRRYEQRVSGAADAEPGATIRLDGGERTPRVATVLEGTGTAIDQSGLPVAIQPGDRISAGARLAGGPFVLHLEDGPAFTPQPRPAPLLPTLYTRYLRGLGPVSLGYAALTALRTLSLRRTFEALLLVNPRTAVIGMETANLAAASRVLRAGVTVVGTRHRRAIRLPDVLLLDGPRVLTNGVELTSAVSLNECCTAEELTALAGGVALAAGSPWGDGLPQASAVEAENGSFDGTSAQASIHGVVYTLEPCPEDDPHPAAERLMQQGSLVLRLRRQQEILGLLAIRPRLASGVEGLIERCRSHGVKLILLSTHDTTAAQAVARRARVEMQHERNLVAAVRSHQQEGKLVALLSDNVRAAEAFAACDLALGLSTGLTSRFPARADLLVPDLEGVVAVLEAGARREKAVRDAVGLSCVANVAGALWGLRSDPNLRQASFATYLTALAAIGVDLIRLQGGERAGSSLAYLVDPRPERWGRRSIATILNTFRTRPEGLTSDEAATRQRRVPRATGRNELLGALRGQLRSPVTRFLLAGAGVSLFMDETVDALILFATVGINLAAGVWQERKVGQAVDALKRMHRTSARVLRDGRDGIVPGSQLVPGDVLLLAPGDRVAADARLLEASGLEVDEAALTGESLPVAKGPHESTPGNCIVLEGSDIVVGTGRAVVFAVGRNTRMGATAAALTLDEVQGSPLGARLGRILRLALPVSVGGGLLAMGAGALWGASWLSLVPIGISTALSVVPEGLMLLAGMGEAGVARRLADRNALVRRLAAVEALGRVDVACADKTGTLTEGRLALRLVADNDAEITLSDGEALPAELRRVLLSAALASPHPEAAGAAAHPTDVAVLRGAENAGLGPELRVPRQAEASFDPSRAFHATVVADRLHLKGAPETLARLCTHIAMNGEARPLTDAGRQALLDRARHFAARGLRVLMVAQGAADVPPDEPHDLTALGFVGIRDPLRANVPDAVRRCHEAGVRVIMLTGDHPATARAIAGEAGLLDGGADEILTGPELAELHNGDLDRRLEGVRVIARATPLDKLRIIEGLRRRGHTLAMTGDGVNDAPALRLADVGVAMGRGGTEVARQAADVVLADDDFATLVEALVEGRGFWQNMRRALGLLLGGNLGELGLIVGTSAVGLGTPLSARQILVVNLITDALPALAVVLQEPEHRQLAQLAREGVSAIDNALWKDVIRRGTATAVPALAAYLLARPSAGAASASNVAFASIVLNQLAQTLEAGRVEGGLSRPVLSAVAGSAGLLVSSLTVPSLRSLLGLTAPTPFGWMLVGAGAVASVLLSRVLALPAALRREPMIAGSDRRDASPTNPDALPHVQTLRLLT